MDETLERTVEAFRKFVNVDNQQRGRVAARRELWLSQTKRTILDAFEDIRQNVDAHERELYVAQGHLFDHFESVQLQFGKIPTGIEEHTQRGATIGLERGAVLVFGQAESGEIVIRRCPFSSRLPRNGPGERDNSEFVDVREPEHVMREYVLEQAAKFFDWAATTSFRGSTALANQRPIGFVPSPTE